MATITHEPLTTDTIASAVLIHPGSLTHHTDHDQRRTELAIIGQTATAVTVLLPTNSNRLPPGYYMLFLGSTAGTPSDATWLQIK